MVRTDVPEYDKEFGLLCWYTDFDGFRGAVKERYEDFIVEEILKDGTPLSLEKPTLKFSGYEGLFTHFIFVKKGIGNFEAVYRLSRILNIPVGFIFYSGNKDRDAITVQRMAIWNYPPEKLQEIDLPETMKIYSPIRELRRIFVGEHKGNRFRITIRYIQDEDYALDSAKKLMNLPLPNFFGYQRFGIARPFSHLIGKLLLLRKYEEAVKAFLAAPSLSDNERVIQAKELILEGKFKDAMRLLPKNIFIFEIEMLRLLSKKEDYKKALKRLPAFLLRMLIEAYQALIFNKLLSKLLIRNVPLITDEKIRRLPIIGTNVRIKGKDKVIKEVFDEIIEEENIKLGLLSNKDFPPLTFKGTTRNSFVVPEYEEVSLKNNNLYIVFRLEKGAYATILLRELLKENIMEALTSRIKREKPELYIKNIRRVDNFKQLLYKEWLQ